MTRIPFNRPTLNGRELEYVRQAVDAMHLSGDGLFTERCHRWFESLLQAPKVLLTTSCTHALELAALLLNLAPGDEVIVPAFTFVSTANAFALRGAIPVFADIRPDTLNIDETRIESLVSPRTRAIVVVHYAGVGCEMDSIRKIAGRHRLAVVEDNAHGLFGGYDGRPLGSLGEMAALSFHETKNVTCGEGGALVLNSSAHVDRAEILREKGTDRSRFFRGLVDKYTWVDLGSSYLPSELLAAFLFGQLEASQGIQAKRQRIWTTYETRLRGWATQMGVRLPVVPRECDQPFHLFYLLLPTAGTRDSLRTHLERAGIMSVSHYVPLHLTPMGLRFGGQLGACPVTEDVAGRLLRLPLFVDLSEADQDRVIHAVTSWPG